MTRIFSTKRSYKPSVNSGVASSFSRTIDIKRKSFIQGLKYGVLGDLFPFRDGYFTKHGREFDKYFPRIYSTGVDIYPCSRPDTIGRNRPTPRCLFTWPSLLCARVIHFFLLGRATLSRRVVDRPVPDVILRTTSFRFRHYRLCIIIVSYSFLSLRESIMFLCRKFRQIQKISHVFTYIAMYTRQTTKKINNEVIKL